MKRLLIRGFELLGNSLWKFLAQVVAIKFVTLEIRRINKYLLICYRYKKCIKSTVQGFSLNSYIIEIFTTKLLN